MDILANHLCILVFFYSKFIRSVKSDKHVIFNNIFVSAVFLFK